MRMRKIFSTFDLRMDDGRTLGVKIMNLYQYVKGLFIDDPENELTNHSKRQDRDHSRVKVPSNAIATTTCHTEQRRYFTGTVTSLNEDGGMIDNHVYFELDCILGGQQPFVGGAAHVTATRAHVHAGWRAIRVDLLSEWHPDEGSETELVVGVVSGWSRTRCVVESGSGEVTFAPNECRPVSGYRPHVGDSIEVELLHQDGVTVVNGIKPLRERTLTGTVNKFSHGNGMIDDDIYFTLSSCCHGYHPAIGDDVSVVCVECMHQRHNWRAYSVQPTEPDMNKRPESGSFPLPSIPLLGLKGPLSGLPEIEHILPSGQQPSCRQFTKKSVVRGGSYQAKVRSCRLPGQRPQRTPVLKLPYNLGEYPVPDELREAVEGGDVSEVMMMKPCLEEPLCMDNYSEKFSTLLFIEEVQREIDIRQFDLTCVVLDRCGPYFSLTVPGLNEGRPSLLVGDKIVVCVHADVDDHDSEDRDVVSPPHWEGYIHEIRKDDILVQFAEVFHTSYTSWDLDVMFTFGRTPLRRMHHVVELSHMIGAHTLFPRQPTSKPPLINFTFPNQSSVSFPNSIPDHCLINRNLNPRQRAAVMRILKAQCRPSPYVLFGPPGTGKTVTLVEAILQVHRLSRGSRILVCAPSNSASDIIAERLHESGAVRVGEMVRLNAIQRQAPPTSIEPYCLDTDSIDVASKYRVVIATCVTAGGFHRLRLGVGHFTHIFVDECGQASEPECLLPVSLAAGFKDAVVVLVGDPCQLGPVLSSRLAGSSGLGVSFLERVMAMRSYCRQEEKFKDHGNYDPLLVTKLIDTYRSHEAILRLYSDLFYHGELVPRAAPTVSHVMCQWEELPNKGFPLIFHGLESEDMQEGNSPSWFNPIEALQVLKYVQALKDNATYAPKASEIGVVTPYRKQVEKIRLLLGRVVGGEGVKVGSVEEFQGQERTAIIVSTVRSSSSMVDSDVRHHLGFLSNPKRFNVAISRAQALLIVIGNPHLLAKDPCWLKLIQYAVENRAYRGCSLPNELKRSDTAI